MTRTLFGSSTEPYSGVARRAALRLAFLAPFFYASYGVANWLASRHDQVGSVVFGWEHHIPFIAWTIVPYWSINLLYVLTLFANRTIADVDQIAARYLVVQVVAVFFFVFVPLRMTFVRPETTGLPGFLFDVLGGFDKPFNQAPSLHIALLVIIWDHWRTIIPRRWLVVWHGWCLLIGVSVLTTWQHHFIDIPTGALLGVYVLFLLPQESEVPVAPLLTPYRWLYENHKTDGPMSWNGQREKVPKVTRRVVRWYTFGNFALFVVVMVYSRLFPSVVILLWPAIALAVVRYAYVTMDPEWFRKRPDGTVSLASRVMLLPYRIGARLNAWAWTRKLPASVAISDEVFLGRFPTAPEANRFATVIDLAAEFERPKGTTCNWISIPMLDLVPSPPDSIAAAAQAVEHSRVAGPVLVCCALGFQRSAIVVADWLVATGRAETRAQAKAILAAAGRPVHLPEPDTAEAQRA